jgi:hypothetical protein
MRILITNHSLSALGGSETVVIDLCRLLRKRGHDVMVFSSRLGHVAELLNGELFPVVSDLAQLRFRPDIIHGQHHLETFAALVALPDVPAISYIHGIVPWQERVALHPRILRYVNLSESARNRVILEKNIPPERVYALPNFVRLDRLSPPKVAPERLRSAVFLSRARPRPWILEALHRVCETQGIAFHQETAWAEGKVEDPLPLYDGHDLVFATGRTALEALARGCAVSTTDSEMLGPLLTPSNIAARREVNLSRAIWEEGVSGSDLSGQLAAYSAASQGETTEYIRRHADAENAIDQLVTLYESVVEEWKTSRIDSAAESIATSDYLRALIPLIKRGEQQERCEVELRQLRSLLRDQTKVLAKAKEKRGKFLAPFRQIWAALRKL